MWWSPEAVDDGDVDGEVGELAVARGEAEAGAGGAEGLVALGDITGAAAGAAEAAAEPTVETTAPPPIAVGRRPPVSPERAEGRRGGSGRRAG